MIELEKDALWRSQANVSKKQKFWDGDDGRAEVS